MTAELRDDRAPAYTELKDQPDLDAIAAAAGDLAPVSDLAQAGDVTGTDPADVWAADVVCVLVDCPGCGATREVPKVRRASAAAFCPTCDYPLFLAVPAVAPPEPEDDSARRRLPGVDGRDALGAMPCPNCGEPNPPDPAAECLRCGALLTPPTPPPTPPPPPEPEIVVIREVDRRWQIVAIVLAVLWLATVIGLGIGIWQWG